MSSPTAPEILSSERRAELLALADSATLIELADACIARHGDPTVLVAPETGLVMLQVREPVCEERFHLGEVVVTRAEIALAGGHGWSIRMGTDRLGTLAAAVCDAVADARADLTDEVVDLCRRTEQSAHTAAEAEWDELRATEVSFEELD